MSKLTPKQRVLKKYPKAFAWKPFSTSDWEIRPGDGSKNVLSYGYTHKAAWANAAKQESR